MYCSRQSEISVIAYQNKFTGSANVESSYSAAGSCTTTKSTASTKSTSLLYVKSLDFLSSKSHVAEIVARHRSRLGQTCVCV